MRVDKNQNESGHGDENLGYCLYIFTNGYNNIFQKNKRKHKKKQTKAFSKNFTDA